MSSQPSRSVRHCPLCGIAMQGSKSRDHLAAADVFRCLTCDTTIRETRRAGRDEGQAD